MFMPSPLNLQAPDCHSVVQFLRAIPWGRDPIRADRTALGTMPAAALQYCEPLTTASAFGWYLFVPIKLYVKYDGTQAWWSHEYAEGNWWQIGRDLLPGSEDYFDQHAPDDIKGYCPPFITQTVSPGTIAIWTGLFMLTKAGWSSLVRPVANVARSRQFEVYEGVVETDRWFGPLNVTLRLTAVDTVIEIPADRPIAQLQPLLRETYAERNLKDCQTLPSLAAMNAAQWDAYRATVVMPSKDPHRKLGAYSSVVRKRRSADAAG